MDTWTPDDLKARLDDGKSVFLKLWKPGCGPCKMSVSATKRMEESNEHGLEFGSINVDDHPEILELAGAESTPTFFVFADKKKLGMFIGFKGAQKLTEFVTESLAKK